MPCEPEVGKFAVIFVDLQKSAPKKTQSNSPSAISLEFSTHCVWLDEVRAFFHISLKPEAECYCDLEKLFLRSVMAR